MTVRRFVEICMVICASLGASTGAAMAGTGCPNEQLRYGLSARLSDCRAYEMVSPLEKSGGNIAGIDADDGGGVVQASSSGASITYTSLASFGGGQGAPVGSQYLSGRGPNGWITENITAPLVSQSYTYSGDGAPYVAFSSDLTVGLLTNGLGGPGQTEAPVENAPLDPGAPTGYRNYYLRTSSDGSNHALLTSLPLEETPEPPSAFSMALLGATPDLKHIVVESAAVLAPGALNATSARGNNLYEWSDGIFRAINVLPDVTNGETEPSLAEFAHGQEGDISRAMSDDGRRVFWTGPSVHGSALYMREFSENDSNTEGRSVQIDASHGTGESGNGTFLTASSDGTKVFFLDPKRLTPDATAGEPSFGGREARDLYEYDVESGGLRDITVDDSTGGANVLGVVGASENGSYLYFVATGTLAGGAVAGQPNLYLWHEGPGNGSVALVATLSQEDESDWTTERPVKNQTSRVSSDGLHVAFISHASITGFDNHDATTGLPDSEIFWYEVGSPSPICVSCNPSGARPIGGSIIPGGTVFNVEALYRSRALSTDGSRVFFDSDDSLAAQDTNGKEDVYEWEHEGAGSCPAMRPLGCVFLISGGTSNEDSTFVDASEDGSNVFFLTAQQLTSGDTDQLVDLYDAREGGGFPQPPSLECTGTGCQGVPAAQPVFATPPSVTFSGVGNFPAAPPIPAKPKAKRKPAKKKPTHKPKHEKKRHAGRRAGVHAHVVGHAMEGI